MKTFGVGRGSRQRDRSRRHKLDTLSAHDGIDIDNIDSV